MSFKELQIKLSYETRKDDPVEEFYVPVLRKAIRYDRIAGYFSSTSLSISAKGIAGLIANNGKMRLITSPILSKSDITTLNEVINNPDSFFDDKLLDDIQKIEDTFQLEHLKALGWLLINDLLEIRFAVVVDDNNKILSDKLFHQKVGLFYDAEGNVISFSGSINETASGWLENIEEIKVFNNWVIGQESFVNADAGKFNEFWNSERKNVKVFDLPRAIKSKLMKFASDFDKEEFIHREYIKKSSCSSINEKLRLFDYQEKALNKWIRNNHNLLLEMATGTGKTRTAIACGLYLLEREEKLITIISCPQNTLSMQWKSEIDKLKLPYDVSLIADSSNPKWKDEISIFLKQVKSGYYSKLVIYTTHSTGSSDDFLSAINSFIGVIPFFFIGDEVHGLGAPKARKGLLREFKYKLGLSATPKRWFDDEGSNLLSNFFGNNSFEFSIRNALTTINPLTNKYFLVNYFYHPKFVYLTDDEMEQYINLTKRISKISNFVHSNDDFKKSYEHLLNIRANIGKSAKNKMKQLENIITENDIQDTLIFTSPELINDVCSLLAKHNIISHRLTEHQGTKPAKKYGMISEREYIIKLFKEKKYKALVAISCLDEGIDIPSATTAIIMSSSTNPREYIQRTGRVIRQSDGKNEAFIYDFVIEPDLNRIKEHQIKQMEKKIFEKEISRVSEMSEDSISNATTRLMISKKLRRFYNGN